MTPVKLWFIYIFKARLKVFQAPKSSGPQDKAE